MEERILAKLDEFDNRFNEMEKKFDNKFDEFEKKIDNKFDKFEKKIDMKVDKKIEEAKKEILDRQLLFETEYGQKIDAMYDILSINRDKYYENSDKINSLSHKVEKNETEIFCLEERVSVLESKK